MPHLYKRSVGKKRKSAQSLIILNRPESDEDHDSSYDGLVRVPRQKVHHIGGGHKSVVLRQRRKSNSHLPPPVFNYIRLSYIIPPARSLKVSGRWCGMCGILLRALGYYAFSTCPVLLFSAVDRDRPANKVGGTYVPFGYVFNHVLPLGPQFSAVVWAFPKYIIYRGG